MGNEVEENPNREGIGEITGLEPAKRGAHVWVNAVVNARRVGDGGLRLQGARWCFGL
jgi:hypothetical protein